MCLGDLSHCFTVSMKRRLQLVKLPYSTYFNTKGVTLSTCRQAVILCISTSLEWPIRMDMYGVIKQTPLHSICLQAFAFGPFRFSLSFAFALLQRLCFFGVSIYCNLNVIFFVSHQKNSPPIVQYPIALVSSGFDGISIPLLMFSIGIYILPSYILIAFCMLWYICTLCFVSYKTVLYMCMLWYSLF